MTDKIENTQQDSIRFNDNLIIFRSDLNKFEPLTADSYVQDLYNNVQGKEFTVFNPGNIGQFLGQTLFVWDKVRNNIEPTATLFEHNPHAYDLQMSPGKIYDVVMPAGIETFVIPESMGCVLKNDFIKTPTLKNIVVQASDTNKSKVVLDPEFMQINNNFSINIEGNRDLSIQLLTSKIYNYSGYMSSGSFVKKYDYRNIAITSYVKDKDIHLNFKSEVNISGIYHNFSFEITCPNDLKDNLSRVNLSFVDEKGIVSINAKLFNSTGAKSFADLLKIATK